MIALLRDWSVEKVLKKSLLARFNVLYINLYTKMRRGSKNGFVFGGTVNIYSFRKKQKQ